MPNSSQSNNETNALKRVLFVDAGVSDAEQLLGSVSAGTQVIHLTRGVAPLEQMAGALAGKSNLEEVHLLAHGEPGAIALAGANVDAAAIEADSDSLKAIGGALGNGAKLALWACSVAAGKLGRTFTDALETATGARVFAAGGLVGAADKGGSWNIGTAAPFSDAAMASYSHTLPTFDGDGGAVDGNQTYTEADNGDGITLTVVFADDVAGGSTATASIIGAGGLGGSTGNVFFNLFADETQTVTVTFSSAVTITSFVYLEADANPSGTYTFTPIGGSGTPVVVAAGAFTSGDSNGTLVTPGDWEGVTGYTITNSGGAFSPGLDSIVYSIYVAPTPNNDPIKSVGGSGNNAIKGAGGNDTLIGGAGDDVVTGGGGNDLIWAGSGDQGADSVNGGAGNDTVAGGGGDDLIEGGTGSDILYGGSGDDRIFVTSQSSSGDDSSNEAWGGQGNDTIIGDIGDDVVGGGSGNDVVSAGRGADVIYAGAGDDDVSGDSGDDTIFGGRGADNISGGAGNDLLFNGADDDTVDGGTGADTLWGGAGDDVLTGGEWTDTFAFTDKSGNDTVTDFELNRDTLDLTSLDFAEDFSLASIASAETVDGQSGVLLELSDDATVFLIGISVDNLSEVNLTL